jgi:hypothetical protein
MRSCSPESSDIAEGHATQYRLNCLCIAIALAALQGIANAQDLKPVVEVEEDVYQYEPAGNGAGPLWCHGSTCLVRIDKRVFASGIETLAEFPPLNNCRWTLFSATVRAGSPPSHVIDALGARVGAANTISYARIRLW